MLVWPCWSCGDRFHVCRDGDGKVATCFGHLTSLNHLNPSTIECARIQVASLMGSMTSSRLSEEIIAVKTIESIEDVDIYNSNQPQIFESSGPVDMFKSGPAVLICGWYRSMILRLADQLLTAYQRSSDLATKTWVDYWPDKIDHIDYSYTSVIEDAYVSKITQNQEYHTCLLTGLNHWSV